MHPPDKGFCLPDECVLQKCCHGSNAIVVPRGLWFESALNQTLDGSDPRSSNPVLNKMTVQANQFAVSGTLTLDAYLNARPVQMVLSGNVTLEEAQWFVDQLRLNRTGKTTAFLLDVTDEFYTVGFVGAVIALAPNATVDNSVNHTASAPPTPWWAQLFNAIVSVAAIAWNAALAVANFFVNLVKWLVNIVVGLVIGLATGDWTYFVDNVVKPFVEAMSKLIKFLIDLVTQALAFVFGPIIDAYEAMRDGVIAATFFAWDPHPLSVFVVNLLASVLLSAFFVFLFIALVAIAAVVQFTQPFPVLGGIIIAVMLLVMAATFIALTVADLVFGDALDVIVSPQATDYLELTFEFSALAIALGIALAAWSRAWKSASKAAVGLAMAVVSFALLAASMYVENRKDQIGYAVAVILDMYALMFAFPDYFGLPEYKIVGGVGVGREYSVLVPIADALQVAAQLMSVTSLIADFAKLARSKGGTPSSGP